MRLFFLERYRKNANFTKRTIPESEVHCPSTEWRFIHAGIVRSKGLSCNYLLKSRGYPPRGGRSAGREEELFEND